MSTRVSFADLLKKGAEKDNQKILDKPLTDREVKPKVTHPTPPTKPTARSAATPPTPLTVQTVAPERDFAKVANSIVRDAVAQGLFIGKSKQIYDFLYLQTRGAIQPKRSARITKSRLMSGADIGSERTLLKNLSHLKSVGLIKTTEFDGQHSGNEYEVFMPEETHPTPPTIPTAEHPRHSPQKVGTLPPVESGVGGVGQTIENKATSVGTKTSFKDNNKDDDDTRPRDGFSLMIERLGAATKKITGKGVAKRDAENWGNLADLLILELEVAARRTDGISSVPAFLTEVLRRQFFSNREKSEKTKSPKQSFKKDTVGKSAPESYEIKPLDQEGKESALNNLREFAEDDFLEDFKKWYVEEDWEWLMRNLRASDNEATYS